MKSGKAGFYFLLLSACISLFYISCRKDNLFNEDPQFRLSFSADTIMFDTVFTTVGSITKVFKVYNQSSKNVQISSVELGGKLASNYRFNVDGRSGVLIRDIEIGAKDSVWVFVEVTVDPNNATTPLVVEDSLIFTVNGNRQKVMLAAFGQDAYFHYPTVPASQNFPAYSTISGVWPTDKPHVVYGWAFVPNDSVLILQAGTRLYMHHNSNIAVLSGGSLKIFGERNNEVIIRGDRLDDFYRDQPGAWGRIWLTSGSINNEIDYAIIQNGRVGVHVDTLGNSPNPTLIMKNTIIRNMSAAGLLAQGSWVEAYNCVFANCGEIALWLNIGGRYRFRHCTVGNYWSYTNRQSASVVVNNYYRDIYGNYQVRSMDEAYFGNCIFWGNKEDEFVLEKYPYGASTFDVTFEHCIVKTSSELAQLPATFNSVLKNQDPLFEKIDSLYFQLQNTSPAIDFGSVSISSGILLDIEGNSRVQGIAPDLGAYEKK
jgi:hypothetical protein